MGSDAVLDDEAVVCRHDCHGDTRYFAELTNTLAVVGRRSKAVVGIKRYSLGQAEDFIGVVGVDAQVAQTVFFTEATCVSIIMSFSLG